MNDADKALASVKGIENLMMEGRGIRDDLANALTQATATLPIDGAPTLSLGFDDPHRTILQSGVLAKGLRCNVDAYPFELTQVNKSGSTVMATLEHEASMALRRHTDPLKVAPGVMTHVQFAKRLVSDEKWLQFVTGGAAIPSKVALTRGTPTQGKKHGLKRENDWDCLGRMASDRGWRRFIVGASEVWYCTDAWLFARPSVYTLREHRDGVDDIDFDYDAGKPVAEITATVRSALWKIPPGEVVTVDGCGPADGKWLVVSIARSLFSVNASVTLHKPQPTLPEPKPTSTGTGSIKPTGAAASAQFSSAGSVSGLPDTGAAVATATDFVNKALTQSGKAYVWGGESPSGFDCSGLVQWAAEQVGLTDMPRVSGDQYEHCRAHGTLIRIEDAEHVKGALLFEGASGSQHVVISLGDGRTIEARGVAYGVGSFSAIGRPWSAAGLVPGLKY